MKHVYCVPENQLDIRDVIQAQARKFIDEDSIIFLDISTNHKEALISLRDIPPLALGEYFVFCPPWTVLLEEPDFKALGVVAGEMEKRGLAYTRLRKIGNGSSRLLDDSNDLYADKRSSFFMTPYVFKTSEFHKFIDASRDKDMLYWQSLEVGKFEGAILHRVADQPNMRLSYWRSGVYNTISDLLSDDNWNDAHLDFNGEHLRPVLAGLGIDPETRGVGSMGGCCYDLG